MICFSRLSPEEKANTLTHFPAVLATLLIAWPLLRLAWEAWLRNPAFQILGTALFLAGMLMMYLSSTLYHAVDDPVTKRRLRVWDHISIYAMIAGSYSPICLSVVGGRIGWGVFIFLWTCVAAGILGKLLALGKYPNLSLVLYLLMGWVALIMIVPLWNNLPRAALGWIVAEGVFYTVGGTYFFRLDEKHPFYHAVWHVFIIIGSLCHTIALWLVF